MITFGIPCKYSEQSPIIECVSQIISLHPNDVRVVVVDSNSEQKGYMDAVRGLGAIVADAGNTEYETGAWWHVYENYPSETFFFIHDSLILKQPIYDCLNNDVTTIAYSEGWRWILPEEYIWGWEQLGKTEVDHTTEFFSVFGSMFMTSFDIMTDIKNLEFDKVRPAKKGDSRAMERLWGIVFNQLGYGDQIRDNSLYGPIHDILQVRNERLDKVILRRD